MREQTMTKALDKAREALEQARERVTEWDRALEQAKTARDQAEDSAPDDPSVLEGFADEYARAEGRVRAAAKGRQQADAAVLAALEAVVRAGLDDARADVKAAEQAHAAHRKKLDALLAKVTELDGADYRAVTLDDLDTGTGLGPGMSVKASKAASLQSTVWGAEAKVNALAYVLEHHSVRPSDAAVLPAEAHEYANAVKAAGRESPASVQARASSEIARLEDERVRAEQRDADRAERSELVKAGHAWPMLRRG